MYVYIYIYIYIHITHTHITQLTQLTHVTLILIGNAMVKQGSLKTPDWAQSHQGPSRICTCMYINKQQTYIYIYI